LALLQLLYSPVTNDAELNSVSDAAEKMGVSVPVVSRVVSSLEQKGFLQVTREGKRKLIAFSTSPPALALKELAAANSHVRLERIISNSAARVLSGILNPPASVEEIARTTRLPEITVRRTVGRLLQHGIVARTKPAEYRIILPRLKEFVEAYVNHALEAKRAGVQGSLLTCGPNALLRTTAKNPPKMVLTGISVFHKYGVKLIETDARDYYLNAFDDKPKQPKLEVAAAHCLARATINASSREAAYAMLAIRKNLKKFDEKLFLQAAADFAVENDARGGLNKVKQFVMGERWPEPLIKDFPHAGGPVWPGWGEFEELVKQYE